jgi:PKD repeat protein
MKSQCFCAAFLMFSFNVFAQSSVWEFTSGTTFEVQTGADFCADIINAGGNFILTGTICGYTPPVANFSGSVTSGCAPLAVTFTDQSINSPTSWAWDIDNNGTTDYTVQNPVHMYSTPGTYSVKLTVSNPAGSDDEIKVSYITVHSTSTAPTGATASPSAICPGGSSTLTVSGGSLGSGASWNWYSGSCGGTFVGTGFSISVSPSSTTTYYVRAEGTCNTTSCVSVTVTLSYITLTTGASPATGSNNNGSAWVVVTGGTPPYTYLWNDPQAQTNDTAFNLSDGIYTVIVTDANGCVESDTVQVQRITDVAAAASLMILRAYPNPFEELLHVYLELKDPKQITISLYNVLGEMVIYRNVGWASFSESRFTTRHLAAGIYFLKAEAGEYVMVKRIMKN